MVISTWNGQIDIRTDEVRLDPRLNIRRLHWNYPKETIELCNTGYCWKAHINSEGTTLSGGPLSHDYQLAQYHCHWGQGIHQLLNLII